MGLCGATAETIVARNFASMVAAGTASHSDHARGVAKLFIEVANGRTQGYKIKDVTKLRRVAKDWDVPITEGEGDDAKSRSPEDIAKELGPKILAEFGQQQGEINCGRKPAWGAQTRGWRLFTKNTGLCEGASRHIGSDACPVPEG